METLLPSIEGLQNPLCMKSATLLHDFGWSAQSSESVCITLMCICIHKYQKLTKIWTLFQTNPDIQMWQAVSVSGLLAELLILALLLNFSQLPCKLNANLLPGTRSVLHVRCSVRSINDYFWTEKYAYGALLTLYLCCCLSCR